MLTSISERFDSLEKEVKPLKEQEGRGGRPECRRQRFLRQGERRPERRKQRLPSPRKKKQTKALSRDYPQLHSPRQQLITVLVAVPVTITTQKEL